MSTTHLIPPLILLAALIAFIIWRRIPKPQPDDFAADMAALARMGRQLWSQALHRHPKPQMPDDDLLCDFIPGCEVELFLVCDDKVSELIAGDIAAWSTDITATTERLVAEVYSATVPR